MLKYHAIVDNCGVSLIFPLYPSPLFLVKISTLCWTVGRIYFKDEYLCSILVILHIWQRGILQNSLE